MGQDMTQGAPVYLDYQATTPVDKRVQHALAAANSTEFGNPHSPHRQGHQAAQALEKARSQVASAIDAFPEEVVFTSGATEANNLAILGLRGQVGTGRKRIVTCVTEHKAVLAPCAEMRRLGFEVIEVSVDETGKLNLGELAAAVDQETLLVSIMFANNEIGTIHDVYAVGEICARSGALFHTDAAQAVGKVPVDVAQAGISLLSISGHKVYGPKGVGALFVSPEAEEKLTPVILGGDQERGLRSGTVPVPLCVGLGLACELAAAELEGESKRIGVLRDRFIERISGRISGLRVNGALQNRLPGNLNIEIPGVPAEGLITRLQNSVSVSTGSACNSGVIEPSHVLRAIGLSDQQATCSIRVGIGRFTTTEEIDFAVDAISSDAERLRAA